MCACISRLWLHWLVCAEQPCWRRGAGSRRVLGAHPFPALSSIFAHNILATRAFARITLRASVLSFCQKTIGVTCHLAEHMHPPTSISCSAQATMLGRVLALLALACAVCAQDIEDGVYVGTDANIKDIVSSTEFVLAEFCKTDACFSWAHHTSCLNPPSCPSFPRGILG